MLTKKWRNTLLILSPSTRETWSRHPVVPSCQDICYMVISYCRCLEYDLAGAIPDLCLSSPHIHPHALQRFVLGFSCKKALHSSKRESWTKASTNLGTTEWYSNYVPPKVSIAKYAHKYLGSVVSGLPGIRRLVVLTYRRRLRISRLSRDTRFMDTQLITIEVRVRTTP